MAGLHINRRFQRHVFSSKRYQRGQALIFGIFVMVGGLAALFFLFNTGQLTREKTKLVNTSDAVAYSAGIMQARTLNYLAYTNRAMVANTVSIAQLVSLASWVRYVDDTNTYGGMGNIGNPSKYAAFYPGYNMIQNTANDLYQDFISDRRLEVLARASDGIIRNVLVQAQDFAYRELDNTSRAVMNEVAESNYLDGADGTVNVDVMPASQNAFTQFVRQYDGDERGRFAEVARVSAERDEFQESRSWQLPALYNECQPAPPDWIERRGGTELLGFDEWTAMDTIAEHVWTSIPYVPGCPVPVERTAGQGAQSGGDSSQSDFNPEHYDASPAFNPLSSAIASASSSSWDYSGIPSFYDLTESFRNAPEEPTLRFSIRVRRAIGQTVTSEGRSAIQRTPRLNAYQAQPAGGNEMVSMSTAEVFFRRPEHSGDSCATGSAASRDNCFGRTEMGRGREVGSLFNPYWDVRLVHDDTRVTQARAMQEVSTP